MARASELAIAGRLVLPPAGGWNLKSVAFPLQHASIVDPAPTRALCCGRQSGKTESAAMDHIDTAQKHPGQFQLFIAPNRLWAKRIIWSPLKQLVERFALPAEFHESDLSVRWSNGHVIALMGADTDKERAKIRGRAYVKIRIDEAQAFPFSLANFIEEDVRPTQRNVGGQLTVQGTPPVSLEHPWFKAIWQNPAYSKHAWNITHWPKALYKRLFGKTAEQALAADLKDRGVTADDITYRREMLGEFLADEGALAYKFSPERNTWTSAPRIDHTTIGVDLGWHDATAVEELGWTDGDPVCYQLEEEVASNLTLIDLAMVLKRFAARRTPAVCFIDSSGNRQGFETIKEVLAREGVPMRIERRPVLHVPDQVGLVNQGLASGRLRLRADSRASSDMRLVTWNNGIAGTSLDAGFHSDAIPGLTYAYQAAVPLLPSPPEPVQPQTKISGPPGFDVARWAATKAAADRPWWEMASSDIEDANPLFGDV